MNIFSTLIYYLSFPYVRYALIVGVLIALCSSLLGVTLVMKRMSFIGDGLSHVAFGAMAISAAVSTALNAAGHTANVDMSISKNMLIVLPITLICAVLLLRIGQNSKIKGDAVIAMISVGALAAGYLVINVFSASANVSGDVCSTLFGSTSIITLKLSDVIICSVLSFIVIAAFIFFYNKIFAVTFDEDFASATGVRSGLYNMLIALIIGVIIVLAMNLIGSLLISALVVFPALSAMRLQKSFKSVIICSSIISVTCALLGILFAIVAGTPVGSTIVVTDIIAFAVCCAAGKIRYRA